MIGVVLAIRTAGIAVLARYLDQHEMFNVLPWELVTVLEMGWKLQGVLAFVFVGLAITLPDVLA